MNKTPEQMRAMGRKGGASTKAKYPPEYFAELGRRGGYAGKGINRKRKPAVLPNVPASALRESLDEILAKLEAK